jgi:hypothetical protein
LSQLFSDEPLILLFCHDQIITLCSFLNRRWEVVEKAIRDVSARLSVLNLNRQIVFNVSLPDISNMLFNRYFQELIPEDIRFQLDIKDVVQNAVALKIGSLPAFLKYFLIFWIKLISVIC